MSFGSSSRGSKKNLNSVLREDGPSYWETREMNEKNGHRNTLRYEENAKRLTNVIRHRTMNTITKNKRLNTIKRRKWHEFTTIGNSLDVIGKTSRIHRRIKTKKKQRPREKGAKIKKVGKNNFIGHGFAIIRDTFESPLAVLQEKCSMLRKPNFSNMSLYFYPYLIFHW